MDTVSLNDNTDSAHAQPMFSFLQPEEQSGVAGWASKSIAVSISSVFLCVAVVVVFWKRLRCLYSHWKRRKTFGTELSARSMPEKRPIGTCGETRGVREQKAQARVGGSNHPLPSLSRQRRVAFQFSHITSQPCWLRQLPHWTNLYNLASSLCSCVDRDKTNPQPPPQNYWLMWPPERWWWWGFLSPFARPPPCRRERVGW